MDKLSAQQRHNNMAAIRGKDTKPEMQMPMAAENEG
jgi:G:T-mismatch repair DNA endonuclease (very short patch repair protein)